MVMRRSEFQEKFGFCDEDMELICAVKRIFNGTIEAVRTAEEQAAYDAEIERRRMLFILGRWPR